MGDEINIRQVYSPTQRYFLYQMNSDFGSSYNNSVWSMSYSCQVPSFGSCFAAGAGFSLGAGLARIGMRLLDRWLGGGDNSSYYSNYAQSYGLNGGYSPWTTMGWFGTSQMYAPSLYGNYGQYTPSAPYTPTTPTSPTTPATVTPSTPSTTDDIADADDDGDDDNTEVKDKKDDAPKTRADKPESETASQTTVVSEPVTVVEAKKKDIPTNKDLAEINQFKAKYKELKARGKEASVNDIKNLYNAINAKKSGELKDEIDNDKDIKALNSLAKKVSKLYAKVAGEDIVTGVKKEPKNFKYYKNQVVNFAKRVPEIFTKKDGDKDTIAGLKERVKKLSSETSAEVLKALYKDINYACNNQKDDIKKNTNNYEFELMKHRVEKFAHNHNIRLEGSSQEQPAQRDDSEQGEEGEEA